MFTLRRSPLHPAQKAAFILAVGKCFGKMPVEVLRRIFEFAVTVERVLTVQQNSSLTNRFQDPLSTLCELSIDSPAI